MSDTLIAILGVLFFLSFFVSAIKVYNKAIALENKILECAAKIDSLKSKLNKVYTQVYEIMKKYAIHEAELVKAVASSQSNIQVLATKYPQLKADQLFQSTSQNAQSLYNELITAINEYNAVITKYNIYVGSIPAVIICSLIGRKKKTHARIN